jgi:hypothetical protein
MEYSDIVRAYILQPNEVFEQGHLRITNIGKKESRVTVELLRDFDLQRLTGGPHIEHGLEFRLRVE